MSVYPAWAPSHVISGDFIRATRPQVLDTNTTQSLPTINLDGVDDKELSFFGEAGAEYLVEAHMLFSLTGSIGVGLFLQWTTPTDTTALIQSYGPTSNSATMTSSNQTHISVGTSGFSNHFVKPDGNIVSIWNNSIFQVGSAPGYIRLNWAPDTGISTDTLTREANSIMLVTRFA